MLLSVFHLFILSLCAKMISYLIVPISQVQLFLVVFFHSFLRLTTKLANSNLQALCAIIFLPHSFFHSPSWQLKAHLTPVSVVDIPTGCWLDRLVTTLLARETDINILPLCCPFSSVGEHNVAGEGEESKEKGKKKRWVGPAIPQSALSDLQAYWILD